MKKTPSRNSALVDKLHKGFVLTCIGVTIYGFSMLGLKYYNYLTKTKPLLDQQKLKEAEGLLAEGSSDLLYDTAKTMKM
ncbi:uncharacterized protein LOC109594312 [Aethina tumida]|uniref:uncharacterized protein LOC109594312 n=1 Tax=Aethina tumida TaxID=116153 RepID=UPI00096B30CC|nr:uncharacterized protein LOC109594312 [Aethina tumida]